MLFKRLTVIQQFDKFHFLIANLEKSLIRHVTL
jgi:hypothetical protein